MRIMYIVAAIICIFVFTRPGLCVDMAGKGTCATTQICYDPETSHMRADWSGINLGISEKTGSGERGPPGPPGPPGKFDIDVVRGEVKALMQVGGKEQNNNGSLEERMARIEFTLKTLIAQSSSGETTNINAREPVVPTGAIDIYGWVPAPNGYQYLIGSNNNNFEYAREFCKSKKSALASVGIRNEQTRSYLVEKLIQKRGVYVWIGLSDLESESEFYWFDGVKSTAFNTVWDKSEPDGGDCGQLKYTGKIHDFMCNLYGYALCER